MINLRRKRSEPSLVRLDLTRQRDGKQAPAMECTTKRDHATAAGRGPRNLDGVLDSLCARGEESCFFGSVNRCDGHDAFSERHVLGVRNHLIAAMGKTLELSRNGSLNFWVAMPGVQHRDTACKVNEPASLDVPELGIFGVINEKVTEYRYAAWRGREPPAVPVCIRLLCRDGFRCCVV